MKRLADLPHFLQTTEKLAPIAELPVICPLKQTYSGAIRHFPIKNGVRIATME